MDVGKVHNDNVTQKWHLLQVLICLFSFHKQPAGVCALTSCCWSTWIFTMLQLLSHFFPKNGCKKRGRRLVGAKGQIFFLTPLKGINWPFCVINVNFKKTRPTCFAAHFFFLILNKVKKGNKILFPCEMKILKMKKLNSINQSQITRKTQNNHCKNNDKNGSNHWSCQTFN